MLRARRGDLREDLFPNVSKGIITGELLLGTMPAASEREKKKKERVSTGRMWRFDRRMRKSTGG